MKNKNLWKLLTNSALSLIMGFGVLPTILAGNPTPEQSASNSPTEPKSESDQAVAGSDADATRPVTFPRATQQTSTAKRSRSSEPAHSAEPPAKRTVPAHDPLPQPPPPLPNSLRKDMHRLRTSFMTFSLTPFDPSAQHQAVRGLAREFLGFARSVALNPEIPDPCACLTHALCCNSSIGEPNHHPVPAFELNDIYLNQHLAPQIAQQVISTNQLFNQELAPREPKDIARDVIDCIRGNYGNRNPYEFRFNTARYLVDLISDSELSNVVTNGGFDMYNTIYIVANLLDPSQQNQTPAVKLTLLPGSLYILSLQ